MAPPGSELAQAMLWSCRKGWLACSSTARRLRVKPWAAATLTSGWSLSRSLLQFRQAASHCSMGSRVACQRIKHRITHCPDTPDRPGKLTRGRIAGGRRAGGGCVWL